jgi:hypothetical protein
MATMLADEKAGLNSLARLTVNSGDEKSVRSAAKIFGSARQGAKQFQEDSYCFWQSPSGIVSVAAVYDGHGGVNGAISSQVCRDQTLAYFASNALACESWSEDTWGQKLESLFEQMHNNIRQKLLHDSSPAAGPRSQRMVDDKGIVRNSSVRCDSPGFCSQERRVIRSTVVRPALCPFWYNHQQEQRLLSAPMSVILRQFLFRRKAHTVF